MFHSWMIGGSKHEAEADCLYALGYLLRAKIDTHTQRFQYVSAAAAAGSGTVAVFCHGCARCSREYTGASRDVERTRAITPCAAGIQRLCPDAHFQLNLYCFFAPHSRQPVYFLYGF